jgi:hypothetical protein
MRTSAQTSIIATQRWNEFKSKVLVVNDQKLARKIEDDWSRGFEFITRLFYK